VSEGRREELAEAVTREDGAALVRLAREAFAPVLRYLVGRLYSVDEQAKWRSVRALSVVAADPEIVGDERARDLLRRFFWALNDESGAVPYGIPEAIGEILAVRAELQATFLPLLCAQLTEEDMLQTGPIERGVIWALGRVGPPVAETSPKAVAALRRAATGHPDPETREIARGALGAVGGSVTPCGGAPSAISAA
jgi:hypothetical protein